jgi:hypothetical protein
MSIYKRGNVYWYDFVFNGVRFQGSTKQVTSESRGRSKLPDVHSRQRERSASKTGNQSRRSQSSRSVFGQRCRPTTQPNQRL